MSKLISLLLLLSIPNFSKTQKNFLQENQSLITSFFDSKTERYNAIKIFSGIGQENESENLELEINLGYRKVLIGNKSKIDFGINCDKSYQNTCELKSKKTETENYHKKPFSFSKAELYTRFSKNEELFAKEIPKLNINLISKAEDWPIGKIGVIGLHHHGDFVNYIKQVYKNENFSFLIGYNSEEKKMDLKKKMVMEFVINPIVNEKDKRLNLEFRENIMNLEVKSSLSILNNGDEEEFLIQGEDLCFSSIGENLFHLENSHIICEKLKSMVCIDIDNCKESTADYDNASVLELEIREVDFHFYHNDYFYYDEDKNVKCRFEEYDLKSEGVCSVVTTFAIGKGFIEKYNLVLIYEKNGTNSIAIMNMREDVKGNIWVWLLLGFIAAAISFVTLVYVCCIRKNQEDDYELYIPLQK